MTIYMMIATICISFILESTLLSGLSVFGYSPNLSLLLIVMIALTRGKRLGGLMGLLLGLIWDLVYRPVIGVGALIYFIVGYVVGMISNRLSRDNILIPFITTVLSTIFYNGAFVFFMFFLYGDLGLSHVLKSIVSFDALLNGILIIPLYSWLSKYFVVKGMSFSRR